MARTDLWTREQMILVLNLYMKLPFGKMDARNPDVKHLASIIGRTAGAVAFFAESGEIFWRLPKKLYLCIQN